MFSKSFDVYNYKFYLAISTSDGRVEDEVWRGEDVYEGDGVGLELSAEMEDGIPDETAAPGAREIATWVIKKKILFKGAL